MKNNSPYYIEIYNELYLKILGGEFKDGQQLPTEMELCKQYFVSRITIQKALSMLVDKGCLTRIAGKGTFVNQKSKIAKVTPKASIGFVICDFSSSYGVELIKSIEMNAEISGFDVIIKNSRYDKEREQIILEHLSRTPDIKGIILQPVHDEYFSSQILNLSLKKYPLVLIDRNLEGVPLPFVGTDNKAITEKVMNYLFECGHKNIAFVSSNPKNTTTIRDRYEAVSEAFSKQNMVNIYAHHYLDIKSAVDGATSENMAHDIKAIMEHIKNHSDITCIFAAEYSVGRLVKAALSRLSISVPADMSLITFDNVADPFYMASTTFIKQNEYEMGKKAVEILTKSIAGIKSETKLFLSADLVIKDSIKILS